MMSNGFQAKLDRSRDLVAKSLRESEHPVVACSFGKNSMIVLHLVLQRRPDVAVLFNNTLVEFPDTYRFKREMVKEWGLNVVETRPSKTFWWIVDNYGFPLFSRKGYRDATKNCCRYLKEYPVEKVLRREKYDLYYTGLTRHESWRREWAARKYGDYFFSRRFSYWKCHPIQEWTDADVWQYHKEFAIPHNGVYDKEPVAGYHQRTGCWCCTIPIKYGKIEFLRKNYPRLWNKLLKKGVAKLILEKKLGHDVPADKIDHWVQSRPCLFDKL